MGEVVTVILLDIIPRMVLKLQHRGKDVMLGLLGMMSALVMSASIKRRVIGGSAVFVLMVLSRMIVLTGSAVIPARRVVMIPSALGRSVVLFVLMGLCRMTALTGSVVKSMTRSVMTSQTPCAVGGSVRLIVRMTNTRHTPLVLGGSVKLKSIVMKIRKTPSVPGGSATVLLSVSKETLIALGGSADPPMINIVLKMMSNVMIGKGSVVNHAQPARRILTLPNVVNAKRFNKS